MDSESRRGLFYHPMIAFDVAGVALGIAGEKSWTREEVNKSPKAEKNKKRKQTPIEEKESYRWIEGLRCAERTAAACLETTCVCVGDSESDIYDVFAAALQSDQANLQLLVRAGQNRNTTEQQDWADQVRKTAKIGDQTVSIRGRQAKIGPGKWVSFLKHRSSAARISRSGRILFKATVRFSFRWRAR